MTRLYLRIVSCMLVAFIACSSPPRGTGDYKIAVVAVRNQQGIFVMNSDSTGKELVFPDANAQLLPYSWSPDGKKIALFLARKKEDADILLKYQIPYHFPLYELDPATGKETRLLPVPVSSFRWSPDGRSLLYFSSYEDPGQTKTAIYLLNLQTGEQKRLTPLAQNCSGAFSPDGSSIVYSLGTDQYSDVYTMGIDGTNSRCLTDSRAINFKPAWSPDGKSIAYISVAPPGAEYAEAGIYVTDPAGTNRKLISSMAAFSVAWSPDGKHLLIQWDGGTSVIDADGKKTTNIGSQWGRPVDAVFAPDGQKIVLRLIRSESLNLYSVDSAGTHSKAVTKNSLNLYSVDLDGTHLKKISDLMISSYSLSTLR